MIGQPTHPLKAIAPPSLLPMPELHPAHEEIDREVISYLVKTWEWPSDRARKGFISWRLSEVVLFMFPTGELERVKLACELLLLGFLMDDWFDHHTFDENAVVVSRIASLLSSPESFVPENTMERMHATLFARILAVHSRSSPASTLSFLTSPSSSPSSSPSVSLSSSPASSNSSFLSSSPVAASLPTSTAEEAVLSTYIRMLACHCDPARGSASTLRDYLLFREVDVGMPLCMALLYWTEDLSLSPQEAAALAPLEHVANYHVSILNDIFSFEREWAAACQFGQDGGAVLVNGVSILADEAVVGVKQAKSLCFSLVRAWEVEFRRMADELLETTGKGNERLARAVEGIERRMSGAEAFSWRTKRYL